MGREDDWYRRFWEGALLVPGWRARSDEILRSIPREERDSVGERLDRLGTVIGREWARDNRVRRVDNARLEAWGARLHGESERGGRGVVAVLDEIEDELQGLLT